MDPKDSNFGWPIDLLGITILFLTFLFIIAWLLISPLYCLTNIFYLSPLPFPKIFVKHFIFLDVNKLCRELNAMVLWSCCKARSVPKDYPQIYDLDCCDIFSPLAKIITTRLILAMVAFKH